MNKNELKTFPGIFTAPQKNPSSLHGNEGGSAAGIDSAGVFILYENNFRVILNKLNEY